MAARSEEQHEPGPEDAPDLTPEPAGAEAFMAAVERLLHLTEAQPPMPGLSAAVTGPVAAAVVVAAATGLACDSRSLANRLGLAHALVLRDCVALAQDGVIALERRDARTQRLFYRLDEAGRMLARRAGVPI